MLLYVNWDGFSYHWYELAKQCGAGTPNLDRMIQNGAVLLNHHCGIPAITNPMQQTLVSGAWPAKTGNCYTYYDRETRKAVQTLRLNRCENIVEAAQKRGLACASVHGWYFENRGCIAGDESRPYIQNFLPNFETRVALLLAYLRGEAVPSGEGTVTMHKHPDFLAIYGDDIDNVCHNGARLPYPEMKRARTLEEWYRNFIYTVQRMDKALGALLELPDTCVALAADHGGMPFGIPAFGVSAEAAHQLHGDELLGAMEGAGLTPYVLKGADDTAPEDAQAVLLLLGTQAQLTYTAPVSDATKARVQQAVRALPFVHRCMDQAEQAGYGASADFCDLFITSRAPFHFGPYPANEFVGGSHAAMEDSVLHVLCAFCGKGIKHGVQVTQATTLVDFAPTLCALLGFDGPQDKTGRVLTEVLAQPAGRAV
ncbi:MAG: alkaline phosphatase family protein [Clostridia bacterium]